jgi:hypothetical protein
MTLSTRERRLLLLLAAAAVALAIRALWPSAAPAGVANAPTARPTAPRGRAARGSELPDRVVVVATDRLDQQPPNFEVGRDLFRFAPPPPPPGPAPGELAEMRRAAEERARAAREAAVIEAARPHPPEIDVRYIGSFGPAARKIAVFVDTAEGGVLNARVGEVLKGKFVLARIGYESVDLKYVDFPDLPARRLPVGE